MFNSVVLDVVIGLVFIYLLYSLFVTILSELLATLIKLRALNLRKAVKRMLNDEKPIKIGKAGGTTKDSKKTDASMDSKTKEASGDSKIKEASKKEILKAFYNDPEIKYLGSSGFVKSPSRFKASSFANAVMGLLLVTKVDPTTKKAKHNLKDKITVLDKKGEPEERKIGPETMMYLHRLWEEAQHNKANFKSLLEDWFERTMEQAIEWYKRKIGIITFVLGLLLAWFFYADTFVIVKSLSTDKDARDKMVSLANAYVQNNQIIFDTAKIADSADVKALKAKMDSLLAVQRQLQVDINNANNILGIGGWPPDTVSVITIAKTNEKVFTPPIDVRCLPDTLYSVDDSTNIFHVCKDDLKSEIATNKISSGKIVLKTGAKLKYFLWLFCYHFLGFLVTAIAISLGAPFWFDLLGKVMNFKNINKEESKKKNEDADPKTP